VAEIDKGHGIIGIAQLDGSGNVADMSNWRVDKFYFTQQAYSLLHNYVFVFYSSINMPTQLSAIRF